jgi:TetR/AcrR family transcriptional repressor of nem operon
MLAAELPVIPREIADQVQAYFQDLSDWLESVFEKGAAIGQFRLQNTAAVEANAFMATVHGAMLSARAFNDPAIFESITQAAIRRLVPAE